ncbi:MAG: hypothetical protein CL949_02645 [Erythrobacter sp.]|jgi:hypothetical protein|nr:hypothetical protein [Erythrobacter sp.]|tara:strand:- start:1351 stop:1638 length:288 start_codon:yes stop_codon:yes gene_type:complete
MRSHLQVAFVGLLAAATSAPMSASAGALGAQTAPPPVGRSDHLTITGDGSQFQIVERPARMAADVTATPALHLGSTVHLDAVIFRSRPQATGAVE